MIVNEIINVRIHTKNIKDFPNTKIGDLIDTSVYKLSNGSKVKINIKCDNCGVEKISPYGEYVNATKNHTRKYYCIKCKYLHSENTLMEKYGVKNVMHLDSVKKTHNDAVNSVDFIEADRKRKITVKDKYGVEYVQQNKEINKKTSETVEKIYGEKYVFLTKENRDKSILASYNKESRIIRRLSTFNKNENLYKKYNLDLIKIGEKITWDKDWTFYCHEGHEFIISDCLLRSRIKLNTKICVICNPISSFSSSQKELYDFIEEIETDIIMDDKSVLGKKHIDIFLPKHSIGIEYNGLYWHSEEYKHSTYHLNKSLQCEENDVHLIHIWEDEWLYKKDIVKSLLKSCLNKYDNVIDIKLCNIQNDKSKYKIKKFLNENYLYEYKISSYNISINFDNKIVGVLGIDMKENEYYISYYCIKNYTYINNSFAEILNYFLKNNNIDKIKSYNDYRINKINDLKFFGFKKIGLCDIDYFLVDKSKRYNKKFKDKLKNEIKIWDCGKSLWEYNKKNL